MTSNGNDIILRIGGASGGIPLGMAGFLVQAIALAYPNTTISNADGMHQMVLRIPEVDYLNLDPDGVSEKDMTALVPGKDDPGLIAFTTGLRADASFGIAPPPWLGQFLSRTADLIEKHMEGPNYIEMTIVAKDGSSEPFKWIVCRRGRPSPHELRQRAEERVGLLEQQLRDAGIEPVPPQENTEEGA